MAIALRSTSRAVVNDTTSGPVSVTAPAGVVPGDVLVAVVTSGQDAGSATAYTSSGWTSAAHWDREGNSMLPSTAVLWKVAGSSEPGTYAFSRTGSTASDQFLVHVSCWSGVSSTNPFAVSPTRLNQTSGGNPTPAPSVTVPSGLSSSAMLVTAHIAMWYDAASAEGRWSTPSGMSPLVVWSGQWAQMGSFYAAVGAGATGERSSSLASTPTHAGRRGVSFALRPATTTTTPPVEPPIEVPPVITPPIDRAVEVENAEWSFAIGPPGSVVRELNAGSSRRVTFNLSEAHEASVTIDGFDPAAREIVELSTDLYVFRRRATGQPRELLYRGRIGKTADACSADGHEVTVPSISYKGVLKRRLLMTGFSSANSAYTVGDSSGTGRGQRWNQVDQMQIAWELVDGIQQLANGDLGIVNGIGQSSGKLRDRTFQMGDSIAEQLDSLSDVIDGFDWDITPTYTNGASGLRLDRWYRERGIVRNEVLAYLQSGSNLLSVQRQVDSSDFANAIRSKGRAPESSGSVQGVEPAPVERYATPGPEGRWDKLFDEDSTTAAGLAERADWRVADASLIRPSYTVELKPGVWRGPDHFWLGDTVKLVVQSGRLNVQTDVRVQTIDIAIDDNGDEQVSVTLGYPKKDFRSKMSEIDRRLARLERR